MESEHNLPKKASRMIGWLIKLLKDEGHHEPDPGDDSGANPHSREALAALRTGVGKKPSEAKRLWPYLVGFVPNTDFDSPEVHAYFLTASLCALLRRHQSGVGMGGALLKCKDKFSEQGLERRLVLALEAPREDLPTHLTGLAYLCDSAKVGLDWGFFLEDSLALLGNSDWKRERTKQIWAQQFWRAPQDKESQNED